MVCAVSLALVSVFCVAVMIVLRIRLPFVAAASPSAADDGDTTTMMTIHTPRRW